MTNIQCPCDSGKLYDACCGKFHRGTKPVIAEELMRSRFSAYVMHELEYLYETTHPDERTHDLRQGIEAWDQQARFVKLQVIRTVQGLASDKTGKVEFIAFYIENGTMRQHHELSSFKKLKGKWYYFGVGGEISIN